MVWYSSLSWPSAAAERFEFLALLNAQFERCLHTPRHAVRYGIRRLLTGRAPVMICDPRGGDTIQPGFKRRAGDTVAGQPFDHLQKDLRRQVFDGGAVRHPVAHIMRNRLDVASIELGYRVFIALLGALDEGLVG